MCGKKLSDCSSTMIVAGLVHSKYSGTKYFIMPNKNQNKNMQTSKTVTAGVWPF